MEEDEPPDYGSLVERELRIADNLTWAQQMWADILSSLAAEAQRQRYVRDRRPRPRSR